MANRHKVKLLRKEKLAKDTWLFAFEKPEGYEFIPGQYQTFTLVLPNGTSDWRDMTITSTPSIKELWLVTKIPEKPSEFKKILFHMPIGSEVSLQGPAGGFTIRDEKKLHVFVSGGIGVNVFYSIIQDASDRNIDMPMILLASFSRKETMLFHEDLKQIENDTRKIIYTLTQEDWKGEKGRISKKLIQKHVKDISQSIFMIAGGQDFVDDMNTLLLKMGVPTENIRIDYFTGY